MAIHAHFSAVDFVVFSLILLASMGIGIFFSRSGGAQQSNNEYLMAGRSMSSIPVAMSVLASFVSSIAILGTPTEVYTFGFQYWMQSFTSFISVPIMAWVFLPVFYNLRLTSSYEYLERRFSFSVRMLGSTVFVIQTVLYTAIVLYGPSLTLESVTGFPLWLSAIVTGLVCTFYTTLGGMKAVIWTDVFQGIVMLLGMITIIIIGTAKVGGLGKVFDIAHRGHRLDVDLSIDPMQRTTLWAILIGGIFQMLPVYATNQTAVQRFLTTRSLQEAKRSVWMNLPLTILNTSVTALAGLVLYAFYVSCDPISAGEIHAGDEILPYFVIEVLGKFHGIPGVFVATLFCGTLSTVASGLNALAAVTVEDFLPLLITRIPPEREALISKMLVFVYGLVSLALAFSVSKLGNMILQMSAAMFGTTGGPMLALFSLGILTKRASTKAVWIGVVIGFSVAAWISIGALVNPPNYPTLPMSISGCASNLTNSIMTSIHPSTSHEHHSVYSISFFWYGAFSFIITYVSGYLASFIFAKDSSETINPSLLFDYSKVAALWRRSVPDINMLTHSQVKSTEESKPFISNENDCDQEKKNYIHEKAR
ncbi:PREDICTED: sodium-coupled monocarboxylate transporter 1-like isoform X2 [Acropora digitifera]|uniref:sodium-coupled monocarboxylate transporter 1-like isoform X1 n=1 Tax=Acropora digitifera TaxID=70779 RepID=UPI00077B245A|nr:PREDICTED: sodium-coupled monocarboxylate transporter 1-like isoform X1 [Acropora digitifera]XP_015763493.1 PREDICTED: sodium-coupled monocarboxylate transporter 1-like isoform X2 [Acropora digitifera]